MRHFSRSRTLPAVVALALLAGCASGPNTVPSSGTAAGPTTLLVRLGSDTIGMEQYTRTATRIDGIVVTRSPATGLYRYTVNLGPGSLPTTAQFSARRGDGSQMAGAAQSVSVRFGGDSVWYTAHRSSGDTSRSIGARGEILPYVGGSYGLVELALARLRATGRDSVPFTAVPLAFATRSGFAMPVRVYGDSARVYFFGFPIRVRHDRGAVVGVDGRETTVKVRVDRVATVDLDALARDWSAREGTAGVMGQASTRDTARATLGAVHLWVDYGRPSLRGRNVWMNGVLGDTIWRTGANAATQLSTDRDIMIGGTPVPAGTYSLWTWAGRNGYHLIVNRQAGQWGTDYHADRDLARIPLREVPLVAPVERFTIAIVPQDATTGALLLSWGTKQLSVPITVK